MPVVYEQLDYVLFLRFSVNEGDFADLQTKEAKKWWKKRHRAL